MIFLMCVKSFQVLTRFVISYVVFEKAKIGVVVGSVHFGYCQCVGLGVAVRQIGRSKRMVDHSVTIMKISLLIRHRNFTQIDIIIEDKYNLQWPIKSSTRSSVPNTGVNQTTGSTTSKTVRCSDQTSSLKYTAAKVISTSMLSYPKKKYFTRHIIH